MAHATPTPSSTWRWYVLLAALRVAGSLYALGMIHPDEFFQSQEVMARHVLPNKAATALHIPWEFQLPTPNRSVLFPSLVAGLPYLLIKTVGIPINGHLLLLLPRLLLCAASFVVDWILFKCTKALSEHGHFRQDPMAVVLGFASSWPALLFMTRPFSNTFETLVLAMCMGTLLCFDPHRRVLGGALHIQTLLLGSLLAIGFFTRFTFPIFFFPLGLELVRRQDELLRQQLHKKNATTSPSSLVPRLARVVSIALQGLVACLFWSIVIIALDTWYFDGALPAKELFTVSSIVIAPWNNLQYNLQHDNLELHGVHPRGTHALVNMPMLFGPLYLAFVWSLGTTLASPHSWRWSRVWQCSCIVIPLVVISLAPHQEPRFLLPLLVPLHLFYGGAELLRRRWIVVVWIVFNVVLALFFGVLHQGGVLPLLLTLASKSTASSTALWLSPLAGCRFIDSVSPLPLSMEREPLVFYKTYMPPRFALANREGLIKFNVIDLAGGSALHTQLQELSNDAKTLLLVAPASVDITHAVASAWQSSGSSTVTRIGSCSPHVSTEDLALDKPLALWIYRLQKKK